MILYWKPVAENIKNKLSDFFSNKSYSNTYIAILLLSDDPASKTYVDMKKNFWKEIWIDVLVYDEDKSQINIDSTDNIVYNIKAMNEDPYCIGIVVQLPLNNTLEKDKAKILSTISPQKDIDWLWGVNFGLSSIWLNDFVPATPKAVINLLNYYGLDDFEWKKVTILWQSNLVWKPLAMDLLKKWAEVFSFNHMGSFEDIKLFSKNSDYIISATGKIHLVDEKFLRNDKSQILIDIWWAKENWKVRWDVNFDLLKDKVKAITPVPWWVWPVTVASLFENCYYLNNN